MQEEYPIRSHSRLVAQANQITLAMCRMMTFLAMPTAMAIQPMTNHYLTDPNPAMEVIKTAFVNDNGDGLTGTGDIVRYSIEVTNTGDITLDNVYIQTETLTDGNGTLLTLSSGVTIGSHKQWKLANQ